MENQTNKPGLSFPKMYAIPYDNRIILKQTKPGTFMFDDKRKMWRLINGERDDLPALFAQYRVRYILGSYEDRETLKSSGCRWDPISYSWYYVGDKRSDLKQFRHFA